MCMGSGISSDDDSFVERSSVDLNDNNLIDSTTTNTVSNHRMFVIYLFYLHDTCLNLIRFLLLIRKTTCIGIQNSMHGKKKDKVKLANKHVKIDLKSSHVWGACMGLPAVCDQSCEEQGVHREIDGGLSCCECWSNRKSSGNSNPKRLT